MQAFRKSIRDIQSTRIIKTGLRYESSGGFSKRGAALEEQFIHNHEKEVLKEFKLSHPPKVASHEVGKETVQTEQVEVVGKIVPESIPAGASALEQRERAQESLYIRQKEAEKQHK